MFLLSDTDVDADAASAGDDDVADSVEQLEAATELAAVEEEILAAEAEVAAHVRADTGDGGSSERVSAAGIDNEDAACVETMDETENGVMM